MAGDDKKSEGPSPDATILVTSSGKARSTANPHGAPVPDDGGHRAIQVGDVLNHIFEVTRFIARGGMGEVFEGVNVNTEERVAIKVMLPSMSADEKVLALFRKEARTLTRLNHPALVQYRVLAQEPRLGVFYIVTEYVDGRNLSDVIGDLNPAPQDLVDLTRRLASGLEAAHALGAIHRDMSPDNVMLEGGVLAGARIIDFGIAKDTTAGAATIIGDGFAGKLNYVAPEQLGDFDQTIGPWTDVYSLGLIILAVAKGKDVDMGTTLVNAVDRRRAGPDLSAAPEELRPMLARMLTADPLERVRSMTELLTMLPVIGSRPPSVETTAIEPPPVIAPISAEPEPSLPEPEPEAPAWEQPAAWDAPVEPEPTAQDEPPAAAEAAFDGTPSEAPAAPDEPARFDEPVPFAAPEPPAAAEPASTAWATPPSFEEPAATAAAASAPQPARTPPPTSSAAPKSKSAMPLVLGGVAALLLAGGAAWYFLAGPGAGGETLASDRVEAGVAGDDAGAVRAALTAGLPSIACAWLDVGQVSRQGDGTVAALHGVAGKPSGAQAQVNQLLSAKNLKVASLDMRDVATIDAAECGKLDALRQIRDSAAGRMAIQQRRVEMAMLTSGNLAGTVGARAVAEFNLGDPGQEMALFGIEPSGKISQLTTERAELVGAAEDLGNGRYRLPIDVNHTGWSGLLLLTGQRPFDGDLLAGAPGSRTGDWSQRFLAAARERGWRAEMVWFNAVDEQPDTAPSPAVQSGAPAPR